MSFINKYGSYWGFIPQTSGQIFWVAPSASYTIEGRTYSASNDNDVFDFFHGRLSSCWIFRSTSPKNWMTEFSSKLTISGS